MNGIAVSIRILSLVLYLFSFRFFTVVYFQLYEQHVKEENDEWGGEKQVLLFILFFHFYRSKKKRNSESSRSAFLCNLEAVLFGQSFCYQTYPFKTLFQIRQFLIPFVILLCI